MPEKLTWKKDRDTGGIAMWNADIGPVHLDVYADCDWFATVFLGDGVGRAWIQQRDTPKSLREAKRQCEAAARKLVKVRECWDGLE